MEDPLFIIPSSFNLTPNQIETLRSEGQQVGIPFHINDVAYRQKGKKATTCLNEYLIMLHHNSIQVDLNVKGISIGFKYDASNSGEAFIFIGSTDHSNSRKLQ